MKPDHIVDLFVPLLGVGCLMIYLLHVALKTGWLAKVLENLDKPSPSSIKATSDKMIAEMNRRVAERKSRQGR